MGLKEQYDFEYLVNEAERFVLNELEKQLKSDTGNAVCKCQDCILDMAAYALNNVKPYYRASLMGSLYAKAMDGTEYLDHVRKAVKKAVELVSKNPSHS
ncbi:MAG: competence protein ComFB [Spirochaetales bacterium]|nr:MAG: competence protein ComFB [Spirochaetales bacterium]